MSIHHRILIIGGGNAGLSAAARLRRAGQDDVTVIEPSTTHYYQPLWTPVGSGQAPAKTTARPQADVMPQGVAWIRDSAVAVDPDNNTVTLTGGGKVSYDWLVAAPGLQLDWDAVPGLAEALATPTATSNYSFDLAPKTWEMIQALTSGTSVFTMPANPIKCGGAPQKIAYLTADYWRKQGVLDGIHVILVLPTPAMFGVKVFSDELVKVARDYGIDVRFSSHLTSVDAAARTLTIDGVGGGAPEEIHFDFLHAVPPQSAPDWIKDGPLADPDNPQGYIGVDKHTLRHQRHDNVFALGDASALPTSKTGAAIRKQAPVLVANLLSAMAGKPLTASYNGYTRCPLVTSRTRMLLAEFDYGQKPTPSIPLIDTTRPRRDMWHLKRHVLPFMYWNLILAGRA